MSKFNIAMITTLALALILNIVHIYMHVTDSSVLFVTKPDAVIEFTEGFWLVNDGNSLKCIMP